MEYLRVRYLFNRAGRDLVYLKPGAPDAPRYALGAPRKPVPLRYSADDETIITAGVSEGLDIAIRAIVNAGDEVLIAEPSYVSYAPCVTLAGGIPVPVECTEQDHFRLNPDKLQEKITDKTKALIINFPNNPTGAGDEKGGSGACR